MKNLNLFIEDIQDSINDPYYKIGTPTIIPKLKGNKRHDKNKCRPISIFSLKDRLIISLTNKFYTEVFDQYFYSGSFAFRAVQKIDGKKIYLTHHDAVQSIQDYKQKYKGKRLWVSECDINKFYDSVHHAVVKKHFNKLIIKLKKENPELYDKRAEMLFYKYLDSYSFVKNVLPLNDKKEKRYWIGNNIPGGDFGWVREELIKMGYFKRMGNSKIGVPQGGALSGLIANIVLDYADHEVLKSSDSRLHYIRFCDDMVIIHPSKKQCKKASDVYYNALKKLHLVPHKFESVHNDSRESLTQFWSDEIKSKDPYKWSLKCNDSFPWFGFVGYEIHFSGELRVRKRSIKKEKKKQKETVLQIIKAIEKGKRKKDETVLESAANRLIGMSVGRIKLSNFDKINNEMCWVNGFKKLHNSNHLRAQLKDLDRYRAKQLSTLLKTVKDIETEKLKPSRKKIKLKAFVRIKGVSEKNSEEIRNQLVLSKILNSNFRLNKDIDFENLDLDLGLSVKYEKFKYQIIIILKSSIEKREPIYYGKPFSYYYQIIERRSIN